MINFRPQPNARIAHNPLDSPIARRKGARLSAFVSGLISDFAQSLDKEHLSGIDSTATVPVQSSQSTCSEMFAFLQLTSYNAYTLSCLLD